MLLSPTVDVDMQARARERMGLLVALLSGRKNAPAGIQQCAEIAASAILCLNPREQFMIANDAPDEELYIRTVWMANNALDRCAANGILSTYLEHWEIAVPEDLTLGVLVDRMLHRLKGDNPVGLDMWRWPSQPVIEWEARHGRDRAECIDLPALEAALLSAMELACRI